MYVEKMPQDFPTTLAVTENIVGELKSILRRAAAGQTSVGNLSVSAFLTRNVRYRSPFG